MRVVFRVDASARMGTGHLMRCLALADALGTKGVHTSFICRSHAGHLVSLLQKRALPVTVLPEVSTVSARSEEDYASWLGATSQEDSEQSIVALKGLKPDWLIVDHYGIGIQWEQKLRPHVGKLMVIDDLANRDHDCDLLLDQNYSPSGNDRYLDLVPKTCRVMTGPRYALLAREFADFHRTLRVRDGQLRRVLVFFGGSDARNMTQVALHALCEPGMRQLSVDVVVGANSPHRQSLERLAAGRPGTTVHGSIPHLAELMAQADLAIGAGGITTWERMCLGLPAVVVSMAENQRPACNALAAADLIHYIGHHSDVNADRLAKALRLIQKSGELTRQGDRGLGLVDGMGAARVRELLCSSTLDDIRVRPAMQGESAYFKREIANRENDSCLLIEAAGLPVGCIRHQHRNDMLQIEWCLDPILEGRGWESQLVSRAIDLIHDTTPEPLGTRQKRSFVGCFEHSSANVTTRRHSIVILSDESSWINEHIAQLQLFWLNSGHRVLWLHHRDQLRPGDFCFLLGCGQIVPPEALAQFAHCLVVHESDLPDGRGWSPLTWQILDGSTRIPVTLLEAAAKVDRGAIYAQEWLTFEGHELIKELRDAVGRASLQLCKSFVREYPHALGRRRTQVGSGSFFKRRTPANSRLNPTATIELQFNLLRVVDNERYPAFFDLHGQQYKVQIEKMPQNEQRPETIE